MELNSIADALSGLQANQTFMDVVGNNIANVNTVGYKTQSARFEDLMNQTLSLGTQASTQKVSGSTVSTQLEGQNPLQVGMGVGDGSIVLINSQGSVDTTGRLTDMAIQGNGYFVVNNGQQNMYTRDGSFTLAPDGTLENAATGMRVQGWGVNPTSGLVDTTKPLSSVTIPVGSQTASATTAVTLAGNLNSGDPVYSGGVGGQATTTMVVYDAQGNSHNLSLLVTKSASNTWNYTITGGNDISTINGNPPGSGQSGTLTFSSTGQLQSGTPSNPEPLNLVFANGASNATVNVDFSKIQQLAQSSQVSVGIVDGSPGGTISTFSVGQDGTVTAAYSNGTSKTIGQIALASFRNPDGLIRQGNNLYSMGINSGTPQVGTAASGTFGTIVTGQLEGSNVDLATQFGQMIQAQQGFNANTKVITTTNSMMQSVIAIVP